MYSILQNSPTSQMNRWRVKGCESNNASTTIPNNKAETDLLYNISFCNTINCHLLVSYFQSTKNKEIKDIKKLSLDALIVRGNGWGLLLEDWRI